MINVRKRSIQNVGTCQVTWITRMQDRGHPRLGEYGWICGRRMPWRGWNRWWTKRRIRGVRFSGLAAQRGGSARYAVADAITVAIGMLFLDFVAPLMSLPQNRRLQMALNPC